MNRENVTLLRDAVAYGLIYDAKPYGFNMDSVHCGTAGCFVGHSRILMQESPDKMNTSEYGVAEWLDITWGEAGKLFMPNYAFACWRKTKRKEEGWKDVPQETAVAVLDILLETGEVNWKAAVDRVNSQPKQEIKHERSETGKVPAPATCA